MADTAAPIQISGDAARAMSDYARKWSGWTNARVVFGQPQASDTADCNHTTRTFTLNPERLILNPNRVLLTVTPFRLRQEALLTGALLHETGHARHTRWVPRTPEARAAFVHSDGEPVSDAALSLARLLEEPRIEALQYVDADRIGAPGLAPTLRVMATRLLPHTPEVTDPNQQIMAFIGSWALRAGRAIAIAKRQDRYGRAPLWARMFTERLDQALQVHALTLSGGDLQVAEHTADLAIDILNRMLVCNDDTGTEMVDEARDILALLFPFTPPEEQPETPGGGCAVESATEPEQDEENQPGEDNQPGEGDESDDVSDESDTDSGQDGGDEQDSEGEGESGEDGEPGAGQSEAEQAAADIARLMATAEAEAGQEMEAEEAEAEQELAKGTPSGAGSGGDSGMERYWRLPTAEERQTQRNAESFLRGLIAPSESNTISLTDAPSATVDGAALAAWKAAGRTRSPRFFVRTQRNVQPSPPVKIAVLVDVSGSMEALQTPSSVLSWALASAAQDLRNFAGRGQQIQSTLVHWGDRAEVIQENGKAMPGIKEDPCTQGTTALGEAYALVEKQIPGFFDTSATPEHRLIVNFTDWDLSRYYGKKQSQAAVVRALSAGVDMISVVPNNYRVQRSMLSDILAQCPAGSGRTSLLRYNPNRPEQIWAQAAEFLNA